MRALAQSFHFALSVILLDRVHRLSYLCLPALLPLILPHVRSGAMRHLSQPPAVLRFLRCGLTGPESAGLRHISGLTALRTLRLSWGGWPAEEAGAGSVTDEGVRQLALGLTQLRTLTLSGCDGVTDRGVAALAELPEMRTLALSAIPEITNAGVKALAGALRPDCLPSAAKYGSGAA